MAKILVVDDELSIRMGIREFAEYQGFEVEEAANGKEAVERCRQKDFDVIIMDIMMPEMDGYEAYKKNPGDQRYSCADAFRKRRGIR